MSDDLRALLSPHTIETWDAIIESFMVKVRWLRDNTAALWAGADDLEEDSDADLSDAVVKGGFFREPPGAEEALAKLSDEQREELLSPVKDMVLDRMNPALEIAICWNTVAEGMEKFMQSAISISKSSPEQVVKVVDEETDFDTISAIWEGNDLYLPSLRELVDETRREHKATLSRARKITRWVAGEHHAHLLRFVIAAEAPEYEKARAEWLEQNGSATGTEQDTDSELDTDDSHTFSVQGVSDSEPDVSLMHSEGKGGCRSLVCRSLLSFCCVFARRCSDV